MSRDWTDWGRELEQAFRQHGRGWSGGSGDGGGRGGRRDEEWGGPWGTGMWGPPPRRGGRGGPPPWLSGLFGMATQEHQRGPRVRRGDVRVAILAVLAGGPLNGYQVIQEIGDRTDGAWRPSPGSVYPTISQLEDEGLVEGDDDRGRRTLRLTDAGRTYLEDHADAVAEVWAPFEGPDGASAGETGGGRRPDFTSLKPELGRVMNAVWQIITTGTDEQRRAAVGVLVDARRGLYQILADHPGDEVDDVDEVDEVDEVDDLGDHHDDRPDDPQEG